MECNTCITFQCVWRLCCMLRSGGVNDRVNIVGGKIIWIFVLIGGMECNTCITFQCVWRLCCMLRFGGVVIDVL
jgi:hypothetical protein